MARRIEIDPVTRIEGHARITLELGDTGRVERARFHVDQFRAFEKLAVGRPFHEMPGIMARTCGICPVSHLIAGAKAGDALLAVEIPAAAVRLRRILHLAQILQSHALSFFYLSAPDLLLGMDADPAQRNVVGLYAAAPELVRGGIALRAFGQEIIARLAGKRIHPAWVVPGGVSSPMRAEARDFVLAGIPTALDTALRTLDDFKRQLESHQEEIRSFANFPSLFLATVGEHGALEHYDGPLRLVDATGEIVADGLDPAAYREYIAEQDEPDSYMKSPYYRPRGPSAGMYRVGPLARLNAADRCGTERADRELAEFRALQRGAQLSSFHYHYARLVEIVYALEQIDALARHPEALDPRVRAQAGPNRVEGVGVAEAPRGTLIHHYRIDANGIVTWANLIIATGHNGLAMNEGLLQVAKHFVDGDRLREGMLNRVEAVIRAFDPCLSCATHELGRMPLDVRLVDARGNVVDVLRRDGA
ncbi:MAG: Ni/Fe hydrogenase subunit alpha [Proteobacteria bacterium]|nr:MAG: Ni/Fe hydrogenase subunit alpha [Pseudomonadota bacterium]